jgi:hypothetical protein
MFENYQICPYTGLRSFTEDESLYFKGREDDIDQATSQLQKNKFLMLTGASGDGKSSLIYAGIIPNARAGFLKSKYSQWCVADFRPMRSPFKNLCRSLAGQLDIADHRIVESELHHGFSALVDLYRNSKRYADPDSVAWQNADDKGKALMKREASNLIILVDQFEEFFTNSENYQNGVPSKESNLVLNLLLETARIALDENLPIYVVFTMRSDYIGQCAAFRGLPEYLGFSQFFVPRLNRVQLQQVIEEPATLSGNQISRRLTERLIHDVTEGVDQLPILQHALNQIWVAADRGNEEMDLIHYAMVGGMPVNELPDEQAPRFSNWFQTLSPEIQACYHKPNLQNVLDTHTNKLYQQASRYYAEKTGKTIPAEDAQSIIRTTFTCLTKIDQSRAVRNRMTLLEITNIIGNPRFDTETVGGVLNIFREPGNTFIHPFIHEEDPNTDNLDGEDVLDITHESLIRNWDYLRQWAEEEYASRSISLDFEQQLGRWVNSNKSNSFLLSIGPLTYFESWFNKAVPNAYWIARYLPGESDKTAKLEKANEILGDATEFLQKSASKHTVTRTIMRYGPKRIAAVLGTLALITLSAFGVNSYYNKQNSVVLKGIKQQTLQLAGDPKASFDSKIILLCEALKTKSTTVDEIANNIKDPLDKLKISNGIAAALVFQGRNEPKEVITRCLTLSDSILQSFQPSAKTIKISPILKETNRLRAILSLAYFYNSSKQIADLKKRNAARSAKWALFIAENRPASFTDIENFNLALENAINNKALSEADINKLLAILSPFEQGEKSTWVASNFNVDKLNARGLLGYGFKHNGLFQELAYLYAALGNSGKALQCMDTLLQNSQINFDGDYATGTDNAYNIASVYYTNQKTAALDEFVNGYCARTATTPEDFYAHLLGRSSPGYLCFSFGLYDFMRSRQNLNVAALGQEQLRWFYNKYRDMVRANTKDPNLMHFQLACSYKNQGILTSVQHEYPAKDTATINNLFANAVIEYNKVSKPFLENEIKVKGSNTSEDLIVPRKFTFIYPDFKTEFHPIEARAFYFAYFSDHFLNYIMSHQLFDSFYPGIKELSFFNKWLSNYNSVELGIASWEVCPPRYQVLQDLEHEISKRPGINSLDLNWLYLYLGRMAARSGKKEEMLVYYNKLQPEKIFNLLRSKEYGGLVRDQSFRLLAEALKAFAENNKPDQVRKLTGMFKNAANRSSLYAFAASKLLKENPASDIGKQMLDSAKAELARADNNSASQPNRINIGYALTLKSPDNNSTEAFGLIKNLDQKFFAIQHIVRSHAYHGQLNNAQSIIPENISSTDQADFLAMILFGYNEKSGIAAPSWNNYLVYAVPRRYDYIIYIDENS